MTRMNISVPDELADAVRTAKLPVSRICQRALTEELAGAASRGTLIDPDKVRRVLRQALHDLGVDDEE